MICYIIIIFIKNSILFKLGKLSSGFISFAILVIPMIIILLLCYIFIPKGREIIIALFSSATPISAAILTIMGVHYTLVQQKNERIDKNNLVFELYENDDSGSVFHLKNALGDLNLQIKIKNISDNYGYIIGLFRICGSSVYQIGDTSPYWAIAPKTCMAINGIKVNIGDDELILVYKDIGDNYYYLLLSMNGKDIIAIEKAGKFNYVFLQDQIRETYRAEKVINSLNVTNENNSMNEISQNEGMEIEERKMLTKPNKNLIQDRHALILSSNCEFKTDVKLLLALRKERADMAQKKKINDYMIFNMQQLIALATYKPHDEISFISIYGLNKRKYELYGKNFIEIILNHDKVKNTT